MAPWSPRNRGVNPPKNVATKSTKSTNNERVVGTAFFVDLVDLVANNSVGW